jgi:FkbM family methyltransferase
MSIPIPDTIKRLLRIWDSRLTPKVQELSVDRRTYKFYRTLWWGDVSQTLIDQEIAPYFDALESGFKPSVIVDVGAATGHFAIPAGSVYPGATVYAFEPSERQRILLERNMRLNRITNIEVEPLGLWKGAERLAFRTNGAESSFAPVSRFQGKLPFPELVPVVSLDQWAEQKKISCIDLIKMDAEGAEIEILEGADRTLQNRHPTLLIQAYHLRNGVRTFEPCVEMLAKYGYTSLECPVGSGLLYAR